MTEMPQSTPYRVLFLCTHNSSRSQMAEGLLRARGGSAFEVFSAGTHRRSVHPLAIKVMHELGIDISEQAGHRAKGMEEFAHQPPMDLVITVCEEAALECPYFPNARQEHWGFPDPSQSTGSEEKQMFVFRQVHDAIAARIETFVQQTPASCVRRSPGTMATFGEVSFIRRRVLPLPSPVFTLEQLDGPALACILHHAAPLFPAFSGSRLTLPILSCFERMDQEMFAPRSAR